MERLYAQYGLQGQRELKLFEHDDHALRRNSLEAERLIGEFILKCSCVGLRDGAESILTEKLIQDEEKVVLMMKGGDLRRNESIE